MSTCSELTIYKVAKENIPRVISLSLSIIAEMNENETVITSHEILQSTDNEEHLCWHLIWVSEEAVKLYTDKWPNLPSANELMLLVDAKVYYGHFIPMLPQGAKSALRGVTSKTSPALQQSKRE